MILSIFNLSVKPDSKEDANTENTGGGIGGLLGAVLGHGHSSHSGEHQEGTTNLKKYKKYSVGYHGPTNNKDMPHGKGIYKYSDGSIYDGNWHRGRRHGEGTYTYCNGDVYIGEWEDGYKSGKGVMKWRNGDVYEGEWAMNKRHGQGHFKGHHGREYKGTYHDDYKHGAGVYKDLNGDIYDGNWTFNRRNRSGIIKYANHDVFHGEFSDDMKHGPGTWYFNIGTKFRDPHRFPYDWTLSVSKVELSDLVHTAFEMAMRASKKHTKLNNPWVRINIGKGIPNMGQNTSVIAGYHPFRTNAKRNQDRPVWEREELKNCIFAIEDQDLEQGLSIKVFDEVAPTNNVLIGETYVNLKKLESRIGVEFELPLSYLKDTHISSDSVRTAGRVKVTVKMTPYLLNDLHGVACYSGEYFNDHEVGHGKYIDDRGYVSDCFFDESGTCVRVAKRKNPIEVNELGYVGGDTGVEYKGVAAYAANAKAPSKHLTLFHHSHDETMSHEEMHAHMRENGVDTDPSFRPEDMMKVLIEAKSRTRFPLKLHELGLHENAVSVTNHFKSHNGWSGKKDQKGNPIKDAEGKDIMVFNGQGTYRYPKGDVYVGGFKDSLRHGSGEYTYANGDKYSGQWVNDYRDGYGIFIWKKGDHYEGEWKFNKRNGRGKFTSKTGNFVYNGYYVDDMKTGYGELQYANGDVYTGTFKLNVKHGYGIMKYVNGDVYTGYFWRDKKSGQGKYVRPGTPKYVPLKQASVVYSSSQDSHQGRECVANLGNDGTESWNKFFSGVGSDNCIVTLDMHPAQKIHRYTIGVSDDHLERSPVTWEVWGLVKDGKKMELLHVVDSEKFTKPFEKKSYELPEATGIDYRVIEFRCGAVAQRGAGLQLGRIGLESFVEGEKYEGEFRDDLPNGWGIYSYDNGAVIEGMFENGLPYQEDDAEICGEGGLFNPHAMLYALIETPDFDEMGLSPPESCRYLYSCVMDIWDHFLVIADDCSSDEIVTSKHRRRVVSHPSNEDLSMLSRTSSKKNSPVQLDSDIENAISGDDSPRTVTQTPAGGGGKKKMKIVPRPKTDKALVISASSDGVHVQAAPGVTVSAAEPSKSASATTINATSVHNEDTEKSIASEITRGDDLLSSNTASDVIPSSEEEGLIVISNDEDVSPSYYISHGLRRTLSKADENGYRHSTDDDDDDDDDWDHCFADFLCVMFGLKQPKKQYYVRGSLDLGVKRESTAMKFNDDHSKELSRKPESVKDVTPQKTFGSLFAFSKTRKAKDAEVVISESVDRGIVDLPTTMQATAASLSPSKVVRNSTLALFNRKNVMNHDSALQPVEVSKDPIQPSVYDTEPDGDVVGSKSEVVSSESDCNEKDDKSSFDWTFGFMPGEETKIETTPSASFLAATAKSEQPVLTATGSGVMQLPPSVVATSATPSHPAESASLHLQDDNVSSSTPRKTNHLFAKKKDVSQRNVQMYKPMRDGRAPKSVQQSDSAKGKNTAGWMLDWF